jgi:hypothetical protein
MPLRTFEQYMQQTYCNVDYNVELCGYTEESCIICPKCIADFEGRMTEDGHLPDCRLLTMVNPECTNSVNYDIVSQGYGTKPSVLSDEQLVDNTCSFTEDDILFKDDNFYHHPVHTGGTKILIHTVALMYQRAIQFARTCHFGLPRPPPSMLSCDVNEADIEFMKVPFF